MPIIKPRNHLVIDIYKAWCKRKLQEDPSLSLVYDTCYKARGLKVLYKGRIKKSNRVINQGEMIMSYNLFRMILETYNQEAIKLVIEGERLELGNRMGVIFAKRKGRNFNNQKTDFNATRLARLTEPDHPVIYHTNSDYCRIVWQKPKYITNETVYNFIPGYTLKSQFKIALDSDPLLRYCYPYVPYTPPIKQTT